MEIEEEEDEKKLNKRHRYATAYDIGQIHALTKVGIQQQKISQMLGFSR